MLLDVAVDLIMKVKTLLTRYRDTGFAAAQASTKEVCEEMNVEAKREEAEKHKETLDYKADLRCHEEARNCVI